jgi:Fe-S-cluster containining protein
VLQEGGEAEDRFAAFADDAPCPALDPEAGTCDLYAARPMTCRIFGPPMRSGSEALGVCELCFHGASDDEIAACEVEVDPDNMESTLLAELERTTGVRGDTIVAFALG